MYRYCSFDFLESPRSLLITKFHFISSKARVTIEQIITRFSNWTERHGEFNQIRLVISSVTYRPCLTHTYSEEHNWKPMTMKNYRQFQPRSTWSYFEAQRLYFDTTHDNSFFFSKMILFSRWKKWNASFSLQKKKKKKKKIKTFMTKSMIIWKIEVGSCMIFPHHVIESWILVKLVEEILIHRRLISISKIQRN